VITQRARMQQRSSSATASDSHFFTCGLVLCGSSAGQSRRKAPSPIPAESHVAVCMRAASKEAITPPYPPGTRRVFANGARGPPLSWGGAF
jgi:hypothetical protein